MPHKTSVSIPWRLKGGRYTFTGSECKKCEKAYFPGRTYCPDCHENMTDKKFSGNGTILTFTENHMAPAGFEKYVPYFMAIIQLDKGPMIAGHVVGDTTNIAIGKKVKPVFRKLFEDGDEGLIHYGMKFELV
ncbi:MAG: Zn-ribbon domain-containing OB-fold protein [Candidatus Aenigmarchaeota archaeon]|nr:Zn-ribbon domain-containing OB-fold protein [Candidatus Aenigmarchaeota archaeon]